MAERYVLSLDLGSSGLRAVLVPVDRPWAPIEGAALPYRVYRPRSTDALAARFVEAELRERLIRVAGEGMRAAGVRAADVTSMSVTAQRGGIALLRGDGTSAHIAPNTDLRAVFEGAEIDEEHGEAVYAATGHLPSLFFAPAKLRWWRNHRPRLSRGIARVATLGSWATLQLTGELVETPGQLAEAGLLDVSSGTPAAALLARLGFGGELVPRLSAEGEAMGMLRVDVAERVGLPARTPVYLAGPDAQTAALGMGAVVPGDVSVAAGWSTPVHLVTDKPIFDAARRTWATTHLIESHWVVEANAGDTGGTLDMVRRLVGPRAELSKLDSLIAKSRVGSNMLAAFWGPHALELASPGMHMGGLLAPTPITYNPLHAGHVARATVENIGYAIADCIALAAKVAGVRTARSMALGGGMANSAVFPQMLADIMNAPVRRHHHRSSAIGAAIVASRPRGEWAGAGRAVAAKAQTLDPDVRGVIEYQEHYPRWRRLRERLLALSDEL
ncbi:MAG: hypothetical protein FJ318_00385 [SAR202 cluster bacterium]|nr:hypothetical protein [SAR202 cluster bacterium]